MRVRLQRWKDPRRRDQPLGGLAAGGGAGDGVGDIDVGALGRFAVERGKIGTVTSVTPASRFGNIEVDDGTVTAFNEKQDAGGGSINGGFFVLSPKVLNYIEGDHTLWERDPVERQRRRRQQPPGGFADKPQWDRHQPEGDEIVQLAGPGPTHAMPPGSRSRSSRSAR